MIHASASIPNVQTMNQKQNTNQLPQTKQIIEQSNRLNCWSPNSGWTQIHIHYLVYIKIKVVHAYVTPSIVTVSWIEFNVEVTNLSSNVLIMVRNAIACSMYTLNYKRSDLTFVLYKLVVTLRLRVAARFDLLPSHADVAHGRILILYVCTYIYVH